MNAKKGEIFARIVLENRGTDNLPGDKFDVYCVTNEIFFKKLVELVKKNVHE